MAGEGAWELGEKYGLGRGATGKRGNGVGIMDGYFVRDEDLS